MTAQVSKGWRTYAITISIAFLILLALLIWAAIIGYNEASGEATCSEECMVQGADSYTWNSHYRNPCGCYKDGVTTYINVVDGE